MSSELRDKVVIIGAGGIGSWFCSVLHRMIGHAQLKSVNDRVLEEDDINVFDPDAIDNSNLRHQMFYEDELGLLKTDVIADRYGFHGHPVYFDKPNMTHSTSYILCADNPYIRNIVYKGVQDYNKTDSTKCTFLDMRCSGTTAAVFTHTCDPEMFTLLLPDDVDNKVGQSCQLEEDTADNIIQPGNMVAAMIGMQFLLNMVRGDGHPPYIVTSTIPKSMV